MSKKVKASQLPEFDMAEHLGNEKAIANYLTLVIEENDSSELAHALGVVARARNMETFDESFGGQAQK